MGDKKHASNLTIPRLARQGWSEEQTETTHVETKSLKGYTDHKRVKGGAVAKIDGRG